ncbi:MAG: class I SAM-dependent methyltransferase [Methylacidiphilales bacterium]|nr:class I SAM-dependent methyltransferase [Candidatus Methylacidiphilales bacterium]
MNANAKPPESYQSRFLERDVAEDYACREYGAESYASSIWEWQAPLVRRLLEEARQEEPAGRHLDFACGTGRITRLTEEIFSEVDALDISPAMVGLARATCPQARFFVGNILESPDLCPGPYASITAFRFLLNLDPPLRLPLLAGLRQRLNPGGMLLINLHGNRHSLRQPAILWKRWRYGNSTAKDGLMLNDMSENEVRRCLESSELLVERVYGTGVLPPTVYRWPLRRFWSWIDCRLSAMRFLRHFCIDLIFVCRRKDSPVK